MEDDEKAMVDDVKAIDRPLAGRGARPHHCAMFVSHQRRGRDRYLRAKLACLVAGAVVGLVGMRYDTPALVDIAFAVILAGFALRFLPQGSAVPHAGGTIAKREPSHSTPDT